MEFGLAPTQSSPRFDAMLAQARMAEALGFTTLDRLRVKRSLRRFGERVLPHVTRRALTSRAPRRQMRSMLGFVPREKIFFDLLDKLAQVVDRGAQLLCEATATGFDVGALKDRIKVVEHEGDQITHELILQVTKSFVTPLDREDIHQLACRLDDILDLVDAAISRIHLYKVGDLTDDARAMCRNLAQATRVLVQGVAKLRRPRDHADILPCCIEIHTCENEGDRLEQHALAALFEHTRDAAEIIKWKDIYEDLEDAIDRCEDAANVLESLVLKSS